MNRVARRLVTHAARQLKTKAAGADLPALFLELDSMRQLIRARVADLSVFEPDLIERCVIRDPVTYAEVLADLITTGLDAPTWSSPVFLLLDHYDSFDNAMQNFFNPLITRREHFFIKVAVRPFGLELGDLVVGDDFTDHLVEYPPERSDDYERLLVGVTARFCPGVPIRDFLDSPRPGRLPASSKYCSFAAFSRLSSGSIRTFFDLCALAVDAATRDERDWRATGFQQSDLHEAAVSLARRELAAIAAVRDVPGEKVRRLIEGLCRELAKAPRQQADVDFEVHEGRLLATELPDELQRVLRKAFQHGALRFAAGSDASPVSLPARFELSRVFLPRYGVAVA